MTPTAKGPADSFWFTTRSALFQAAEPGWLEIAAYAPAIGRYLASRYPRLPEADRDDVAQEVLIEMRERLVPRHDRSRGRFRQLLQVAIKHRVIDRLRRRRGEALADEPPAPTEADIEAIDLETALLEAVAAAREELTHGAAADRDALYALADRIVHGRPDAEIAARLGASPDAAARLLRRARERILRHLLRRELERDLAEPEAALAVDVARELIQRPAAAGAALGRVSSPPLRAALDEFAARFRAARAAFPALDSPAGAEFRRGLELILS